MWHNNSWKVIQCMLYVSFRVVCCAQEVDTFSITYMCVKHLATAVGNCCSQWFVPLFPLGLQQVSYWIASPSLPLRVYGRIGKVHTQFMCFCDVSYQSLQPLVRLSLFTTCNWLYSYGTYEIMWLLFQFMQQFVFLLHNEDERESWISAIKKLQPKGTCVL